TATALAQLATPSQNKFFIWVFLGMTAGVMLVAFVSSLVRRYEFERQQKEYEFIKARALNDAKALS
ncbi:MAG TPA: hypothetical protein VJA40_00725, partial [archaeon]|nr:hypothetical protein [archaeon]